MPYHLWYSLTHGDADNNDASVKRSHGVVEHGSSTFTSTVDGDSMVTGDVCDTNHLAPVPCNAIPGLGMEPDTRTFHSGAPFSYDGGYKHSTMVAQEDDQSPDDGDAMDRQYLQSRRRNARRKYDDMMMMDVEGAAEQYEGFRGVSSSLAQMGSSSSACVVGATYAGASNSFGSKRRKIGPLGPFDNPLHGTEDDGDGNETRSQPSNNGGNGLDPNVAYHMRTGDSFIALHYPSAAPRVETLAEAQQVIAELYHYRALRERQLVNLNRAAEELHTLNTNLRKENTEMRTMLVDERNRADAAHHLARTMQHERDMCQMQLNRCMQSIRAMVSSSTFPNM